MLVDSHVNLHSEQFKDDLDEVIHAARRAGVDTMLTISDRLESTPMIKAVAEAHDFIWRSVGVHPHHAKDYPDLAPDRLVRLAEDEKVVGIGECGLDFHHEYSDRAVQAPVFEAHIKAAQRTGLPLIIHSRNADKQMRETLERAWERASFTPLLHCFTGGKALAQAALEMGGYLSFSGVVTFKNADDIRAVAKAAPMDRIIIETDCPYLAPAPMRGRRNEPAFLLRVAEKLAEIKGVSLEEIAAATTANFFALFPRARASGQRP
jgi:TatD DNase family protein